MKNLKVLAALAVAALWLLSPGDSEAKARKTISSDGPYPVGVRVTQVEANGRVAPALLWYPADVSREAAKYEYNTGIVGDAALDAPLLKADEAPYPLIVFSHGMGGCAPQHVFYNENLASHGYVIIALDHAEASMCHISGEPEIKEGRLVRSVIKSNFDLSKVVFDLFGDMLEERQYDFAYRPAEVSAAIDAVLAWNRDPASFLFGAIDPDKIGMSGHSLGGLTTFMVSGMPFYCEEGQPPPDQCDFEDMALDDLPNPCCLDYVREMDPFAMRDERIKASLAMSSAVMYPELGRAASELEIPIMLINGDDEKFEVPIEPIQTIYDNAPAPKYLIVLKKTDHMTAADSTAAITLARLTLPGFRSHFDDKAEAYKEYSVAFFDVYLKGDETKKAILEGATSRFVDLQYDED